MKKPDKSKYKKASCIATIPPKIIKLSVDFLTLLLTRGITEHEYYTKCFSRKR